MTPFDRSYRTSVSLPLQLWLNLLLFSRHVTLKNTVTVKSRLASLTHPANLCKSLFTVKMVDGKKTKKRERTINLTNKHLNAKPLKNARPMKSTDPGLSVCRSYEYLHSLLQSELQKSYIGYKLMR